MNRQSENITFPQRHWRVVITMRAIWPPLGKGVDLAKSVNTLICLEGINKLYITYCSHLVLLEGSVVRSHLCFLKFITGSYIWQILPFTLCMHKRHEIILNICLKNSFCTPLRFPLFTTTREGSTTATITATPTVHEGKATEGDSPLLKQASRSKCRKLTTFYYFF